MKKIRVLHIVECAGGGVDVFLRALISNMDSSSFEHILVGSYKYNLSLYKDMVLQIIRIDMVNDLSPFKDFVCTLKLRHIIRESCCDIIYCHSSKAGGLGRLAALGYGKPVIYNPHGWSFECHPEGIKRILYIFLEKLLSRITTRIITISNFERDIAIKNRICSRDKFVVIKNGIDLADITERAASPDMPATVPIPDNAFVFGVSARLCELKAPDVFLKAAKIIKANIGNAYFIWVGDGPLSEKLKTEIKELGLLDCFHITGWVNNPYKYITRFDVALLLSRHEGFGLALTEYMALGKSIVASDAGAIPEVLLNGRCGIVVPVNDYEAVAKACIELYNNDQLRYKYASAGKRAVNEYYNMKYNASSHCELIQNLLNK